MGRKDTGTRFRLFGTATGKAVCRLSRSFPHNECTILLLAVQEAVHPGAHMKMSLLKYLLSGRGPELPQSLRRDISTGQEGKLRNKEHLSNRSSLSQLREGLQEDVVLTKQEHCQEMPRIMRLVEQVPRGL